MRIERTRTVDAAARGLVDLAVHEAVCELTESGGAGRCLFYAYSGAAACHLLTGARYVPQVGSLRVLAVPPDGWLTIDASGDGFSRGEFHAWVARAADGPMPMAGGTCAASEWVDFSARHYRTLHETLLEVERVERVGPPGARADLCVLSDRPRTPWTAPEPPAYLWHDGAEPPPWVAFSPDHASCHSFLARVEARRPRFDRLLRLTVANLRHRGVLPEGAYRGN